MHVHTWAFKPYMGIQTIHGHPKSCMVWKEQASRDPYVHGLKSPFPTTTTGITSRPVGLRPQVKRLHSVQKVGIPKKIGGRERGENFGTRVSSSRTDWKTICGRGEKPLLSHIENRKGLWPPHTILTFPTNELTSSFFQLACTSPVTDLLLASHKIHFFWYFLGQ